MNLKAELTSPRPSPSASGLPPLLVDRREAGRLLGGVCSKTIDRLIGRGELVATRVGGRVLVAVDELQRYVERGKRQD